MSPVGNESWEGRALPIEGEAEIAANTTTNDVFTITGSDGHTADFLVCRLYAGTEMFYVDISGNVVASGNISGVNLVASGFVATKDNGTVTPDTDAITSNGGLMVAAVSGTVRLYFRQNGTVKYINTDG